jgi:hypothetical protein
LLGRFVKDPQIETDETELMRDEIIRSIINQTSHNNLLFTVLLNKHSRDNRITLMNMLTITKAYRGSLTNPSIFQAITVIVNTIIT